MTLSPLVTVADYATFLARYPEQEIPYEWEEQQANPDAPVRGVSWYGANAFALAHGGQLISEAQWLEHLECHEARHQAPEWCRDRDGERRVLRGGRVVRDRSDLDPDYQADYKGGGYGFRVVRDRFDLDPDYQGGGYGFRVVGDRHE